MSEESKDLGDKAKEAFEDAKGATKDFAEDAKESAKEFTDSAKETFNSGENKKILAGILAIVLGGFGVHKFILGYSKEGIIMLIVSIVGWFLCGIPSMLVWIVGLIEGIIYLTKSDQEFYATYQVGRKPWF
tara:strand:- start:2560 stop:2952 length:393 start_codon:yes stop_codon:yes gene_type:complete